MKSCKKKKIEIDLEININKKILSEQKFTSISTAASAKNTKKYGTISQYVPPFFSIISN